MINIAGYTTERKIGEGHFSEVFLVKNRATQESRAVKIPTNEEYRRLIKEEGIVASGLRHPNIAEVYDVVIDSEVPYLLMEFAPGRNLEQLLRRTRLDRAQAIGIIVQIGDALVYAHEQGVLHCDLKPSNIIVRKDSGGLEVKVTDFNLGKIVAEIGKEFAQRSGYQGEGDLSGYAGKDENEEEFIRGTLRYMAPEMLQGEPPTVLSDMYSVGIIMEDIIKNMAGE